MNRCIRWRQSAIAIAAAACISLVGCGGNDEDPPDSGLPSESKTTPTDATRPTSGSSAMPPAEPEIIDNTSPAAAKAFARHVVDLINYANSTLDAAPFADVIGSSCSVCKGAIESANMLAAEGDVRVEGGHWSVKYLRYVPGRPRQIPAIDIVIQASDARIYHPNHARPEAVPGFNKDFIWTLSFTRQDGWELADWEGVDDE